MAISQKMISGNDQPAGGRGVSSIGGARGLGASGTLITEITGSVGGGTGGGGSEVTASTHSNILLPFPPLTAAKLDDTLAVMDNKWNDRFDETNYYHGSGTLG